MAPGLVYPVLGDRKISEITTLELLDVLRTVEGRGRHESARRLRSVCGRVFRYAIATGRAKHDLTGNLCDALTTPRVRHRAAITNSQEVGPLLRAIDGFAGHDVTRLALRPAPHVFVPPGELRHAEWSIVGGRRQWDRADHTYQLSSLLKSMSGTSSSVQARRDERRFRFMRAGLEPK